MLCRLIELREERPGRGFANIICCAWRQGKPVPWVYPCMVPWKDLLPGLFTFYEIAGKEYQALYNWNLEDKINRRGPKTPYPVISIYTGYHGAEGSIGRILVPRDLASEIERDLQEVIARCVNSSNIPVRSVKEGIVYLDGSAIPEMPNFLDKMSQELSKLPYDDHPSFCYPGLEFVLVGGGIAPAGLAMRRIWFLKDGGFYAGSFHSEVLRPDLFRPLEFGRDRVVPALFTNCSGLAKWYRKQIEEMKPRIAREILRGLTDPVALKEHFAPLYEYFESTGMMDFNKRLLEHGFYQKEKYYKQAL